MATPAKFYTAQEVANELNVSKSLIYKMVHKGEIPHAKFGDTYRFSVAAIDQWIEDQCQSSLGMKTDDTISTMQTEPAGAENFQRALETRL